MLTSCGEEFLDRQPIDQISVENFYRTESDLESGILAAYTALQSQQYFGEGWRLDETASDDSRQNFGSALDNFNVTAGASEVRNYWAGRYRLVTLANVMIEKAPAAEVSQEVVDQLVAEARFLRAIAYYDLVRIFGGVPKITTIPSLDQDLLYPRSSVSEIYDLIKEDLAYAADILPLERDMGRATAGAANAFLASVHLTLEEYEPARDRSLAVINPGVYALMPDYGDLWVRETYDNNTDMTQISSLFFYPRPGEGMFNGQIEIDWVSVGQPLEEQMETAVGVLNYSDTLVGAGEFFAGAPGGITYSVSEDGFLTMSGDGSSPQYQQVRYTLRDDEGNAGKADAAGSDNKLYVRARVRNATEAVLRIDLVDEEGYESTNAGAANTIAGEEFMTYTYDYAGRYEDGGYGGTSCTEAAAPCPVDAQRITGMNFYPAPDTGMFTGDLDVNWVSFGQEISVNVQNFAQLDGLRLFPNPATDELGVEYDLTEASQVSVCLFDALGRRVMVRDFGTRSAGNNFNRVDVNALPTGTYHLQVMVNGVPARAQTILKR
ncbi:MAG: RagB/SusD family nutrient uptake outer membrane protein [Lewinella sp.]